jgi:hypothetical protein
MCVIIIATTFFMDQLMKDEKEFRLAKVFKEDIPAAR